MKKLEKQFLSALKRAVKEFERDDEIGYLMDICDAPYDILIVKSNPKIRFKGSDTTYVVSIDMTVECGSNLNAVLMEIAHKLYLAAVDEDNADGGILSQILNGNATPEINYFWFPGESAYSWDSRGNAIFHIEQECGCSWLLFPEEVKDTPFFYKQDYSDKLIRKELILKRRSY